MSQLFETPRTIARQTPQSMASMDSQDFPGKHTEVGCHFLSPALQADSLPLSHQGNSCGQNLMSSVKQIQRKHVELDGCLLPYNEAKSRVLRSYLC